MYIIIERLSVVVLLHSQIQYVVSLVSWHGIQGGEEGISPHYRVDRVHHPVLSLHNLGIVEFLYHESTCHGEPDPCPIFCSGTVACLQPVTCCLASKLVDLSVESLVDSVRRP